MNSTIATIRPAQMRNLHRLLNETGLLGYKHDLVWKATGQRTESSKELTIAEADRLIKHLEKKVEKPAEAVKFTERPEAKQLDKLRKKMISYAWEMDWTTRNKKGNRIADIALLDAWCIKYGQFKKSLNEHSLAELPLLITQFSKAYSSYIKAI